MIKQFLGNGLRLPLAIFVLGLCLAASAGLWRQNEVRLDAEALFQRSAERVAVDVATRFMRPIGGLNGLKGMYAARPNMKRAEFRNNIASRYLPKEFPGVRGFGFIEHVMRADVNRFLAAERMDGAPLFALRQLAEREHEDLYVVKLIEPAANNLGAEGLDVGSEANRRAGIRQAIDSGEPTMTEVITLVQDAGKTPGALLYVPVFARGAQPATVSERRAALLGVLYAPIVFKELFDGISDVVQGNVDMALSETGGSLLYNARQVAGLATSQNALSGHRFVSTRALVLAGRELTLQVISTPKFDAAVDYVSPWLMFAGIAMLSALLALLTRQQATGRLRAEALARQMTEELREASKEIGELNQRYFLATESTQIGIWDYLIPEKKLIWNKPMYALYGLREEDFPGAYAAWKNGVHADDKARGEEAVEQALQAIKTFAIEFRVVWPTGEIHHIQSKATVLRDEAGNPLRVIGVNYDITESKQLQDQLRIAATAFESQEGIMISDANHVILRVNHAFTNMMGFTAEETVGQKASLLRTTRHDAAFYGEMWEAIRHTGTWQGEIWNRRKSGKDVLVWAIITAVTDATGAVTHYVATQTDITERKRIENDIKNLNLELEERIAERTVELLHAKDEAESANRAKTVFLANTSHELRTPMSAIIGMTELARRRATDPKQVDYLDKASRASAALLALINGILDCASLEANQLTLEHRPFKLAGVVENLAGLFEGQALEKGLLLSIEIEAGLANQSLLGDPLRLGQILQNLTDNAIKFTAQGFVIVELGLVEETASAMQVRFGVRDTGIGISLADQRRIFDNFEQADGSLTRRYGGSGLGLGLCRQLAGLMGGEIGVDSQPGTGANFWFMARLQKADAAAMPD